MQATSSGRDILVERPRITVGILLWVYQRTLQEALLKVTVEMNSEVCSQKDSLQSVASDVQHHYDACHACQGRLHDWARGFTERAANAG